MTTVFKHPRTVDIARGGLGALVALAAAAVVMAGLHQVWPVMALVPSIGASAVLVFCIPASPLAQPRAVLGGNLISALVGLGCGLALSHVVFAPILAVGLAIAAMLLLGCLHPPGGAVAMSSAAAAASTGLAAIVPVLAPLGVASLMLVAAACLLVRLTGRSYPHKAQPAAPLPGYLPADLDAALDHYGERLDVSREDLDALFREVERQGQLRQAAPRSVKTKTGA